MYRDAVNTPAFLHMLPDVTAQRGIDIGCGDGHNTRLLAARGAQMFGADIAPTFIRHAAEMEQPSGHGIWNAVASALQLPFPPARSILRPL